MDLENFLCVGLLLTCLIWITYSRVNDANVGMSVSLAQSGRQMCYSCAYNLHPFKVGYNCVTNPKNWTVGDWRMRCPNRCTSSSHYDKETGEASYFYRGCSGSGEVPEDGCTEDELKYYCFFTCTGHYCNDGPAIDETMMDDIEIEDKSSSAQIFPSFSMIVIVKIVGIFANRF